MSGEITMGMLMAYSIFIQYFYQPILSLVRVSSRIHELYGNLMRLDEILDKKIKQKVNSGIAEKSEATLEVKNLTFGYNKMQEPLFKNLNFKIKAGEKVAFVGSSGSGKSTLAKLLSGIYAPWDGQILYGNLSLNELSPQELSEQLAVVDQDIFFFDIMLRDVLTFWDESISDDDLIRACKDACIHDDIVNRNNGYYEMLKEGGRNFSGGQQQRLEIARALIRNPRFLILDEATSALDPITEKNIEKNIKKRGCTTIFIAHRLSTIRDCDQIIVLEKGEIVERGNHQELIEINGVYAALVRTDG